MNRWRDIELEESVEFEHENLAHELLMKDPSIGLCVAKIRAMAVLLQKEREQQNYCRLQL
jgi:hypothetical protein